MTRLRMIILLLASVICLNAQSFPDWSVRRGYLNFNYPSSEYSSPSRQLCSTDAYENNAYISRDGDFLYTSHFPGDYNYYLTNEFIPAMSNFPNSCPDATNFVNSALAVPSGSSPVSVTISLPGLNVPCPNWASTDIVYAQLNQTAAPNNDVWLSVSPLISESIWFEHSIAFTEGPTPGHNLVVYNSNKNYGETDLYFFESNTSDLAPASSPVIIPVSQPGVAEGNPHIERIDPNTYLLLYDDHDGSPIGNIHYAFYTYDNISMSWSWSSSEILTSVSSSDPSSPAAQPHLWQDPIDNSWWLYYTSVDGSNKAAIWRARLFGCFEEGQFDRFGDNEMILSANDLPQNPALTNYTTFGVGCPSLTSDGDLSFIAGFTADDQGVMRVEVDAYLMERQPITPLPCLTPNDWASIANEMAFFISEEHLYQPPYIQPMANDNWEDALYITRDGLNLYTMYFPGEFFKLISQVPPLIGTCLASNPLNLIDCCPGGSGGVPAVSNYIQTPYIGTYPETWPGPPNGLLPMSCNAMVSSNVIQSSWSSINNQFEPWTTTAFNYAGTFEEGICGIISQNGPAYFDMVALAIGGEIYFSKDMPADLSHTNLPTPTGLGSYLIGASGDSIAGNPHIEKISPSKYLMLLDDHAGGPNGLIYYSYYDESDPIPNWSPPVLLHSVNNAINAAQPHLWQDPCTNEWWIYFTTAECGKGSIYRALLNGSIDPNNPMSIDNFGPKELVISAINKNPSCYNTWGVGEPTLTANGDLSFVTVYETYDPVKGEWVANIDPWFLPRIPYSCKGENTLSAVASIDSQSRLSVFPNPTWSDVKVKLESSSKEEVEFVLYNTTGEEVLRERKFVVVGSNEWTLPTYNLSSGLYLLRVTLNNSSQTLKLLKN